MTHIAICSDAAGLFRLYDIHTESRARCMRLLAYCHIQAGDLELAANAIHHTNQVFLKQIIFHFCPINQSRSIRAAKDFVCCLKCFSCNSLNSPHESMCHRCAPSNQVCANIIQICCSPDWLKHLKRCLPSTIRLQRLLRGHSKL